MRIARVRKPHGAVGWVASHRIAPRRCLAKHFRPLNGPVDPVGPAVHVAQFLPPVLPTSRIIGLTAPGPDLLPNEQVQ